jgi:hypothetical protein
MFQKYFHQHPSDFFVSEDAEIEHKTVATLELAVTLVPM